MGEQSVPHRNARERDVQPETQPETGTVDDNEVGSPGTPNNAPIEVPLFEFNTEEFPDDEDLTPEEFARLDSQLDALFSALDDIEQKNDSIHAQLLQLLHANREIRQQLQLVETQGESESTTP